MLAGLSQCWILSVPPDFCASAMLPLESASSRAPAAAQFASLHPIIGFLLPCRLFLEPHIFHAVAVVDAVHHRRVALDVGMPARAGAVVVNHRARHILSQAALDLPYKLLAFLLVGLHRLLVEQFVDVRIGVAVARARVA